MEEIPHTYEIEHFRARATDVGCPRETLRSTNPDFTPSPQSTRPPKPRVQPSQPLQSKPP